MKEKLILLMTGIIKMLLTVLICNYLYIWTGLNNKFNLDISFIQWLAIIVIFRIINPSEVDQIRKNDK
jgi:hypothetical protein